MSPYPLKRASAPIMSDLTAAAASVESRLGEYESNLANIAAQARLARTDGAKLIVFPEACLTGYGVGDGSTEAAIGLDHPVVARAAELAADLKAVLAVGLMERPAADRTDRRAFLTHLVFDEAGTLSGRYRKIHLGPTEEPRYQPGADPGLIRANGATLGLQLCFDAHFPELSGLQALGGADLLLTPHASPRRESPRRKIDRWLRYLSARAYDNTVYLAACNPVGDNGQGYVFSGAALILGPKGEVMAEHAADEPGYALARLTGAQLTKIRNSRMGFFRASRRPELYTALAEPDDLPSR